MPPGEYDITGSIKAIEELKLGLLQSVVSLLASMVNQRHSRDERLACLAESLARTYMLAAKLGISFNDLDEKAADDIKVHILKEGEVPAADYAALHRHITRRKP
ncbi:MAG: MazG-like family protein [Defluviitaleaceae bacterium]|nr:MazG-like family protein [Defluviitaleaceae bacterium]